MRRKKLLTFLALMLTSVTGVMAQSTGSTIKFDPADTKNISVTVGGAAQTPTNGKIQNVAADAEVKVIANQGYKLKTVEVKKTKLQLTIGAGTALETTLDITGCTTWADVITKNSDKLEDSSGKPKKKGADYVIYKGESPVGVTDNVDPDATDYVWTSIS